jgi:hypothetical protein
MMGIEGTEMGMMVQDEVIRSSSDPVILARRKQRL